MAVLPKRLGAGPNGFLVSTTGWGSTLCRFSSTVIKRVAASSLLYGKPAVLIS